MEYIILLLENFVNTSFSKYFNLLFYQQKDLDLAAISLVLISGLITIYLFLLVLNWHLNRTCNKKTTYGYFQKLFPYIAAIIAALIFIHLLMSMKNFIRVYLYTLAYDLSFGGRIGIKIIDFIIPIYYALVPYFSRILSARNALILLLAIFLIRTLSINAIMIAYYSIIGTTESDYYYYFVGFHIALFMCIYAWLLSVLTGISLSKYGYLVFSLMGLAFYPMFSLLKYITNNPEPSSRATAITFYILVAIVVTYYFSKRSEHSQA